MSAPLDLDAVRARHDAYAAAKPTRVGGFTFPQDPALARASANDVPALLAELERLRTNAALLSCSTMGEAFDRLEELLAAERELAAARRDAERARDAHAAALAELERLRGVLREGVGVAEWQRNEVTTWKRKAARIRAELGEAKARISAAATVQVWTNEDGKRFVFADDLMAALDPNPEATPAAAPQAFSCVACGHPWSWHDATRCGKCRCTRETFYAWKPGAAAPQATVTLPALPSCAKGCPGVLCDHPEACPLDAAPQADEPKPTALPDGDPAAGTFWERSLITRFVAGGPVHLHTVREQVGVMLAELDAARKPLPVTAPDPAGCGHCGLCGSEDCPGKPGTGCSQGPFEDVELPGMWEDANLTGGQTDVEPVPADGAVHSEDHLDPGAYYGVSTTITAECGHCGLVEGLDVRMSIWGHDEDGGQP